MTERSQLVAPCWLFEKLYVLLALIVSRDKLLSKMELRHLRYFTAVAEQLNYSEASRRIHVAQPAISQTILDLEEELEVRLLLRDRRTVRLTAAGETFRREALEILRRNQEAVRLTKRASLGEVGQLRIGFYPSTGAAVLPALVQEYHRHFPDVDLTLREMTSQQQLEAFDEGQLDVGFAWPLPAERSKEFHEELVYTDYLYLVLPSAHPLTRNLAVDGTITSSGCPVRGLCFFTAKALRGYMTKCSRYAGAGASSLRAWSRRPASRPRSCFLWSRASASQLFPAVYVTWSVQVGWWYFAGCSLLPRPWSCE
jgi:hypothetical protein